MSAWYDIAAVGLVAFMGGLCVASWLWSRSIARRLKEDQEAREIIDRNKWERLR